MNTELIQNEWLNKPLLVVIGRTALAAIALFLLKFVIIYCLKNGLNALTLCSTLYWLIHLLRY